MESYLLISEYTDCLTLTVLSRTGANTPSLSHTVTVYADKDTQDSQFKEKADIKSNKPPWNKDITYQEPSRARALVDGGYERPEHDPIRRGGHHTIHWGLSASARRRI